MTDEQSLLGAIHAEAAGDNTPRMVYADWLEDRGESERAEFIRVQCWLAANPPHGLLSMFADGEGGVAVSARGGGYYTVSAIEGHDCKVGDRVDVLRYVSGGRPVRMHGLKVVKFIDQHDPFEAKVVLRRDGQSAPWAGDAVRNRERELLRSWTRLVPSGWPRVGWHCGNIAARLDEHVGAAVWFRRGLPYAIRISALDWLARQAALAWSPGCATACPDCRGHGRRADHSEAECTACGGVTGTGQCGTGKVPLDLRPGAMPIREVILTTDPRDLVRQPERYKRVLVAETGRRVWRDSYWPGLDFVFSRVAR